MGGGVPASNLFPAPGPLPLPPKLVAGTCPDGDLGELNEDAFSSPDGSLDLDFGVM